MLIQRTYLYLNELYQTNKGINTGKIMKDFPPALKNQVMMHLFSPLLSNVQYFSFMERNLIEKLSQYLEYELYVEHDFLCVYDEPADKVQILETGKVKILDEHNNLVNTMENAGDIIGDISFFLNENRKSASVQAATFVECVSLNKNRLNKVSISCPVYLDKMKDIAMEKKQRNMKINNAVHDNLKRLVKKNKIKKFADLTDALPEDIRDSLESMNEDIKENIYESKLHRSSILMVSPKSLRSPKSLKVHIESDAARNSEVKKSSFSRSHTTDILSLVLDEDVDDETEEIETQKLSYWMNLYRAWDGFVAVAILLKRC